MFKNIIFDLDGTLSDPLEGVAKSIQYTLDKMGCSTVQTSELKWCIGPPIRNIFSILLNSRDDKLINQAIDLYNKRYSNLGMYENKLYPNINAVLEGLKGRDIRLFVATFKPTKTAIEILIHFDLAQYFDKICGSNPSEEIYDKNELVASILTATNIQPGRTIMIGDRNHDIIASKKNKIYGAGVSYGYGSEDELRSAGADYIVETTSDLLYFGRA